MSCYEPDTVEFFPVTDELDRLTGGAKADLDFRAYRDPLDHRAECLQKKRVALVAAVKADFFS